LFSQRAQLTIAYRLASKLHVQPPTAPISTCLAAELFTEHGDAPAGRPDIEFFTSHTSESVSGRGPYASPPLARKGERPKPRLVQYQNHPRNDNEPFNLQDRVFPHRSNNTGPSGEHSSNLTARLLAAEEGHHPISKGEADGTQKSDLHTVRSGSHDQHLGPEGGRHPHAHQDARSMSHENAFMQPSQQHGFNERPLAPVMPPWTRGALYDYTAALQGGWYPPPLVPYLHLYQPGMHPPYHRPYAEGGPQANYNAQQAAANHGPDYYSGGIHGGYGTTTPYHRDPTSLGQSATLPDVATANTSPDVPVPDAPHLGPRTLSESPRE